MENNDVTVDINLEVLRKVLFVLEMANSRIKDDEDFTKYCNETKNLIFESFLVKK